MAEYVNIKTNDINKNLPTKETMDDSLANKISKVPSAITGNLARFNSNGEIEDSKINIPECSASDSNKVLSVDTDGSVKWKEPQSGGTQVQICKWEATD